MGTLLPGLLFGALVVFTSTFGVRLPTGMVSLLPMTTVAAYLVTGLATTGWIAFAGTIIYGLVRHLWAERLQMPHVTDRRQFVTLIAANVTAHTASILAGGAVFEALGKSAPLTSLDLDHLLPLVVLALTYMATNHLILGPIIATRGRAAFGSYLRSLPNILLYEGGPLLFAPLVALIYTRLGEVQFLLFALLIVLASLITRSLALTSGRLERRVRELGSLQAVGQVLSASLNLDTILAEVHTQVAALMPAENFYVALYDPGTDEVAFPLAFEDGKVAQWRSRRAGKGLSEHILRTGKPMLVRRDVNAALAEIGIESIGRTASSWLGVPILSEQRPVGVLAVQSYTTPGAYDTSHMEVLVTIASQAAVAIQNARLYERTDDALARRVQELDSILRTTREGILLLDRERRVLAANRALAGFLGITQAEMDGQSLGAARQNGEPLVALVGYTDTEIEAACQALEQSDGTHKQVVVVPGSPERHVERTLAAVRDRDGATAGWLIVFRDVTEEIELARLKEDLTHMLVHDLRSPLTAMMGSLDIVAAAIAGQAGENTALLITMAKRSSERMLRMVNDMLDINRLESGQSIVHPAPLNLEHLLLEAAGRVAPLASEAEIKIDVSTADGLPLALADAAFIGRVLSNLLDNAIKFTPDGGLVRLWARPDPNHTPPTILLGVTDSGPGIPPEEQGRLFEKFQQAASVTGRRAGTGLGLPFCRLVVEAHGGEIWVESEVGEGTTFVARLPTVEQRP
jgi:PAS domain S-box-containing protein